MNAKANIIKSDDDDEALDLHFESCFPNFWGSFPQSLCSEITVINKSRDLRAFYPDPSGTSIHNPVSRSS